MRLSPLVRKMGKLGGIGECRVGSINAKPWDCPDFCGRRPQRWDCPLRPPRWTRSPSRSATLDEHSGTKDQPANQSDSISGQVCQRIGKEGVVVTLRDPRSKRLGKHEAAGLGKLVTGDSRQH